MAGSRPGSRGHLGSSSERRAHASVAAGRGETSRTALGVSGAPCTGSGVLRRSQTPLLHPPLRHDTIQDGTCQPQRSPTFADLKRDRRRNDDAGRQGGRCWEVRVRAFAAEASLEEVGFQESSGRWEGKMAGGTGIGRDGSGAEGLHAGRCSHHSAGGEPPGGGVVLASGRGYADPQEGVRKPVKPCPQEG